jgi:organic radical activating enzyme
MKLRLLLFEACNRNCEGCCNKDWDLTSLPVVREEDLGNFHEYMLTGGEPMLCPQTVNMAIDHIRMRSDSPIYMYTAKVDDIQSSSQVLSRLDGICLTLHEPEDFETFCKFNDYLLKNPECWSKSLRLNVFKGVELQDDNLSLWNVKKDIEWIKDCPLPDNEIFMRWD